MHSSDRTLLASLGFADPDKKDKRHTLACQYLAQPEVMRRVFSHLVGPFADSAELTDAAAIALSGAPIPPTNIEDVPLNERRGLLGYAGSKFMPTYCKAGDLAEITFEQGKVECAIRRRDTYLVGFWDMIGTGFGRAPIAEVKDTYAGTPMSHQGREVSVTFWRKPVVLAVEVKATPADVADVARQMELYMGEPLPVSVGGEAILAFVVATLYPMSSLDKATLKRKKIHHIFLGAPFNDWRLAQSDLELPRQVEF